MVTITKEYALFNVYNLYNKVYLIKKDKEYYIHQTGNKYLIPLDGVKFDDLVSILNSINKTTKTGYLTKISGDVVELESKKVFSIIAEH